MAIRDARPDAPTEADQAFLADLLQMMARWATDLARLETDELRSDPLAALAVVEGFAVSLAAVADPHLDSADEATLMQLALTGEYFSLTATLKKAVQRSQSWLTFLTGPKVGPAVKAEIQDSHHLLLDVLNGYVTQVRRQAFESDEPARSWADMGGVFVADLRRILNVPRTPRVKRFSAQGLQFRPTS